MVVGLRIVALAERPDLTGAVARWHWDEWGHEDPAGSLESWTDGLRRRSGRDGIPITWVALLGDEPVGSVALIESDMASHPELTPWLSGLFVLPESRAGGVGSALTAHCESAALELDVPVLHLYTTTAEAFYLRRGWEVAGREVYGADEVAIMVKTLAAAA